MKEETVKKKIWKILIKLNKGQKIDMVPMKKELGCSLAYVGSIMRYAFESGFLEFDENGNYKIKKIPNYDKFQDRVNEKYNEYRKATKGTGTKRKRKVQIPKEFKIEESTILDVISHIIEENKSLKESNTKLIKYAKKIKKEKEKLIEEIEKIEI